MQTNTIIGYHVQDHNGMYVSFDGTQNFRSYDAPAPVSQPDAYRRLAAFIEENPAGTPIPRVVPVYRELSPLETASQELGGMLESLCKRHGLDLGLSREQMETQIAKELADLGANRR
jgi:hypothetical protein